MATTVWGGQFLRYAQLIVTSGSQAIDLSALRFRFEVRAADNETPNTLVVRVYNLAQDTVSTIIREYTKVTLAAGYVSGNQGNIFQGDIKQFFFGKERNVDSYLEIRAGDGDQAYNNSIINQTFPKGTTDQQQLSKIAEGMGLPVAKTASGYVSTGGALVRGKTLFGMARVHMADLAAKNSCRWSIQNGVVTFIPDTSYLPGQVVQINSATGMIGTPEQTDNGIVARCLLNPLIRIGQAVQINNADINQSKFSASNTGNQGLAYNSQYYPADTASDGLYRVLVAEHVGDTRGTGDDFYTEITCLTINSNSSSSTANTVQAGG